MFLYNNLRKTKRVKSKKTFPTFSHNYFNNRRIFSIKNKNFTLPGTSSLPGSSSRRVKTECDLVKWQKSPRPVNTTIILVNTTSTSKKISKKSKFLNFKPSSSILSMSEKQKNFDTVKKLQS